MWVDQNASFDSVPDTGALDLARLEHHVAVRQHRRSSHGTHVGDNVEGMWVQSLREGVLQEERGQLQQVRVVLEPDTESLQSPEVVSVSDLAVQLGIDRPVSVALGHTEGLLQTLPEIGCEPVVVEQGVVDVKQEDHVGYRVGHLTTSLASSVISVPASACETGQFVLAASACCTNAVSSMPGTRASQTR